MFRLGLATKLCIVLIVQLSLLLLCHMMVEMLAKDLGGSRVQRVEPERRICRQCFSICWKLGPVGYDGQSLASRSGHAPCPHAHANRHEVEVECGSFTQMVGWRPLKMGCGLGL